MIKTLSLSLFISLIMTGVCIATTEINWTSATSNHFLIFGASRADEIFALSKEGEMWCLDKSGKLQWKLDMKLTPIASGDFYSGNDYGNIKMFENGRIAVLATEIDKPVGNVLILSEKGKLLGIYGKNAARFDIVQNTLLYVEQDGLTLIDSDGNQKMEICYNYRGRF